MDINEISSTINSDTNDRDYHKCNQITNSQTLSHDEPNGTFYFFSLNVSANNGPDPIIRVQ